MTQPELCSSDVGVFTVAGHQLTLPPDDLEPVRAALADADVVGLGESAHASEGFIGLKIRLSRELIERAGLRAVTWESARVPARKLDHYVQTCSGDAGEAVKNLYEIWADVQTRDFARWLCEWNQAHPEDRVQVHGFDVQDPDSDRAELEQLLPEISVAAPKLLASLSACDRRQQAPCKSAVATVRTELEAAAERSGADAVSETLATARIALTSYAAWQEQITIPDYARSFEARDVAMASVFSQLRELHFPGKKALIWAHNIHVVKRHETVSDSWVGGPIVTQGTALERELGEARYRAVAMIGFDVWLNRPEQRGRASPRPSPASLEAVLHALGSPGFFIDARHPRAGSVLPLNEVVELGAPGTETHVPSDNYDGILYLESSPMAEVLR